MKLEHSFDVEAPLDVVWKALIDVERVAPCLPGASITEVDDGGVYHGEFTVKLGPTTASYRGRLELAEADEAAHRATMRASGQDKRGGGSAKATIVSALSEAEGGTRVATETDFTITGRLARFGRGGMIKDVSNRLLRDFSDCLARTIVAPAAEESPAADSDASAAAGTGEDTARSPAPRGAQVPQAKPVKGLSLLLSVLWERIKRLFGRG